VASANTSSAPKVDSDAAFRKALAGTGSAVTEVSTDPRVFERITLGLYREPSAAIRELISNAYDADAKNVTVTMKPPVFDEIVVEDDGIGMSPAAIDQVVHHVGGSLKRSTQGEAAGVTTSVGTSPGGRKLIGQMGIGLYSVARLTRHFTVETKQEKDSHRVVIDINLTGLDPESPPAEGAERYVAGYARVTRERVHSAEVKRSYTRVRLHDIDPEARRILQSVDRWEDFYAKASHRRVGELRYHVGRLEPPMQPNLPWPGNAKTGDKFLYLVNALSEKVEASASSPSLRQTLDYYLDMLWRISLSAPLQYVERHPFSLTAKNDVDFYSLEGDGTPEPLNLSDGETIGHRLGVAEPASPGNFHVVVDGVELKRPVVFRGFTRDERMLQGKPKMFIGRFASEVDGANLSGTAYFFWSYETKPKENNGILVRLSGASGTLFDPAFLDFRTTELVRLRQVSSEVFTATGLENALNVDRESFVDSDSDYRALQRWVHRSMTRIFSRLKADQRALAAERKAHQQAEAAREAEDRARAAWKKRKGSAHKNPPRVIVSSRSARPADADENTIFIGGVTGDTRVKRRGGVEREAVFSAQLRAIVYILDSWGLLEALDDAERSGLVNELATIIDPR
jgi:hypothetical protein